MSFENVKITNIHYHRNGLAGDGFRVVTFEQGRGRSGTKHMVAVVGARRRDVRVLDAGRAAQGIASDCFDGPAYEDDLRDAIFAHEREVLRKLGREMDAEEERDLKYGEHECRGSHGVCCLLEDQCVVCGRKVET